MLYWNPDPVAFRIPIIDRPIMWYGVLFALGFFVGVHILRALIRDQVDNVKKFSDRLVMYVLVATVVGARLGHVVFYEPLREYLVEPWRIAMVWEGGLASHGGAVAILIALWLFGKKVGMSMWRILDFVVVPTAFAGCCIRVGNFINQEVLGTPTNMPWGVVFMRPADGSVVVARHPAQLYEALFYLGLFIFLWLYKKHRGAIFLIAVFGFRFFIEFFKEEQSVYSMNSLLMGQMLSIPMVLLGIYLLYRSKRKRLAGDAL